MGLVRFIHDIIGYRGQFKERHAMLCVIEAHVKSNPDQWPWTGIRTGFGKHGNDAGNYNSEKEIFFNYDSVWVKQYHIWKKIELTNAWKSRICSLSSYLQDARIRTAMKQKKETKKRALKANLREQIEIVDRFRNKPTPPWGNSGVKIGGKMTTF
jgi:hypothetical protein